MRSRSIRTASTFLAAAALAGFSQTAGAQVLFSDSFETGTFAGNWDIFSSNAASDFSAQYVDYTTLDYELDDGLGTINHPDVPTNPNGSGTQVLQMKINNVSNAVNSISAYPKFVPPGGSYSGNYKLTFDIFMGYNGPPLGGTASTEFMLAGINQGAAGNRVAGPLIVAGVTGENTGNTVALSGEGGSATDYRTYIDQTNQVARGFAATGTAPQNHSNDYYDTATGVFPSPPFETAGAPGKRWVAVEISQIAGVITWKLDGKLISSYADTTRTSGNITLGYMDVNATSEAAGVQPYQYILYDNVVVSAVDLSLYWDTNGTTAGSGGPSPSGAWDGVATNFNSDSGGAGAGPLSAATTSANTVIFSAGTDGTGPYNVAVSGTQSAAAVRVDRGAVTFTGGTIATGAFNVAAGASASVGSAVSSTTGLTKTGAGTLAVTSTPTHTGGTNVVAGTLQLTRMHEGNAVTIASGAKLQILDSSPTLPDHPSGDNAFVSRPSSLTIAPGGTLDLGNNDLIIDYTTTSPLEAIEDMIASGFNGGEWNGPGIISSTALNDPNFVLAVAENALLLQPFGDGVGDDPLFAGKVVDDTTVLVKFTHRVDLDLDGLITGNDAAVFNAFFNEGQPATWQFGDLDYDGVYTGNDAAIFNGFYNESLASVPEPASLALAACGLALLRPTRRRRIKRHPSM